MAHIDDAVYNFQLPYTEYIPSDFPTFNHRLWCHLANKLKPYCNKRTAAISK